MHFTNRPKIELFNAQEAFFPALQSTDLGNLKRANLVYSKMAEMNGFIVNKINLEPTLELVDEIAETVKERIDGFNAEEPSENEDREKRVKQIKSILTKKRRALFDLFTILRKNGLKFKKGLAIMRDEQLLNKVWQSKSQTQYVNRIVHRFTGRLENSFFGGNLIFRPSSIRTYILLL